MKSKETLYRILFWALVEVRHEATEVKNHKIFAITHTFHNLPLYLLKATTEEDYEKLLAEVEEMTKDNEGLTGIVNHVKKTIERHGLSE